MIRRTPFVLFPFLLCLSLFAACGESGKPASGEGSPEAAEQSADGDVGDPSGFAPTAGEASIEELRRLRKPWTGDLDGMAERRVLRLLTVYSPGRYYLEDNGEEKGVTKEMAVRFEDFLNKRFGKKTVRMHVAIIPLARSQLIPALLAGYGDLVNAGLTITSERKQDFDFSIPASRPLSEVLVTGPTAPPLAGIDDLSGKTVYVRQSSSYRESLEALNKEFAGRKLPPVDIQPVSEYLEDDDLIEMVDRGLLPWVVVDSYKPKLWKGVFENIAVRDDIVLREGGQLGWAFRKNSPQLAAAVNEFLKHNREGTLFGNMMRQRYIQDFDYAAHALGDRDYQRFLELQHIFEKYGEQYEVDYLLAAAQGYQESRLDQSKRSKAGAIGVMQMLPSTARDRNVDIPDISKTDPNIHAGIKYVAFLRGRYFSDEGIDHLNGTLLALAAYNAGPSRIARLRKEAAGLGYDPNQWFDNVELVVAKDIGGETVRYVANIFKYYIAYRFAVAEQANRAEARERAGLGSGD